MLLKALSLDYERGFSTDLWNSEPASGPQSPKDRYHAFVYRLAYACTSDKGRNTISSVAVMEDEDSYLFIFACNQISSEEGERVSEHIKSLLRKVSAAGRSQAWPTEKRQDDVLKQILLFNRYRIEVYLKRIVSFATTYLEGYQDGRDEGMD